MPLKCDKTTIGIADVFCGVGGLTYGVTEAVREQGLVPTHVLAMDSDPVVLDVYRRNFDPPHLTHGQRMDFRDYALQGERRRQGGVSERR